MNARRQEMKQIFSETRGSSEVRITSLKFRV